MALDDICTVKTADNWPDIITFTRNQDKQKTWIFRGQRDCSWPLKPMLERAFERFGVTKDQNRYEEVLLRSFKRRAHLYLSNIPEDDENLEWLALMRHYTGPTRLLDFTYSFYAGLFFAIQNAMECDTCTVWAIDHDWCRNNAQKQLPLKLRLKLKLQSEDKTLLEELWKVDRRFVYPVNPFRLNDRLSAQQGLFLLPGKVSESFESNLCAQAKDNPKQHIFRLNFRCSKQLLQEVFRELYRMNINAATLYPGLEGYAKGHEALIATPEILGLKK